MESLDDLLVASDLDAEDKQQQPDEQGDDWWIFFKSRFRKR